MPDPGLMEISGAQKEPAIKYTSLATIKFIGGLQSQRSYFASIDTRYNSKFLGGKPDALIAGSNVEVSNRLTLQRRPGVVQYGTPTLPKPIAFYEWRTAAQAVPNERNLTGGAASNITLMVDTASALYTLSPTYKGLYVDKSALAAQTNVYTLVNTLYLGDGADLYKIPGCNLLRYSNTWAYTSSAGTLFSGLVSPWTSADIFSATIGQTDPNGQTNATEILFSATGSGAYIEQEVTPNYTPIGSNTFTFSVWMKYSGGALSVDLEIADQSGSIVTTTQVLTASWAKYQVTGTMNSGSNVIKCIITNPTSSSNSLVLYGAQLEVGGPATPTQITQNLPQGVYLWGITAPTSAPTFTFTPNTKYPTWQPNTNYSLGYQIIDSNGNVEQVVKAGESGSIQPTWQTGVGTQTPDGAQGQLVQWQFGSAATSTLSMTLPAAVTASDGLFVFIFQSNNSDGASHVRPTVTDNQGNTYTAVSPSPTSGSQVNVYTYEVSLFYVRSAAAGTTTISISNAGPIGTFALVAEFGDQAGLDGSVVANLVTSGGASFFSTGGVTTTNATDLVISFNVLINNLGTGAELGEAPAAYVSGIAQQGLTSKDSGGATIYLNMNMAYLPVSETGFYNPTWGVANPATGNVALFGMTAALKSTSSTLIWQNMGPAGINPTTGYQYYYAYMSSLTGHVSNVSPISQSTGIQTGMNVLLSGQLMPSENSGNASHDPQVDMIAIFRNTDGGAYFYLLAMIGNGSTNQSNLVAQGYNLINTGSPTYTSTTFTYEDSTLDTSLTTSIYAPLGLLNALPPSGMVNMDYFAGRMWGSVNNLLYYNTAADNYSLINETQNGVPAESWAAANVVPFDSAITRINATSGGLLVFTQTDIWVVTGQNILTGGFNPLRILQGHGLLSYNAMCRDGSTIWIYTSDRQMLMLNASNGSMEVGFPIGDVLEENFDPRDVYIARHISGSQDNAVYVGDGSSGWYRLNPNQVGASMSGEQTPVWSPKADFTSSIGGIGAIASIQVTPGVHKLLIGETSDGNPVLNRDITTFSDNGTGYAWSATIGSILLVMPGELAETESVTTEMNNSSSNATQCGVSVLLDEISGAFESLTYKVPDPPQLATSTTVLSKRFYLAVGTVPPVCRHMQIQVSGLAANTTKDEILAITIRGARIPEQG